VAAEPEHVDPFAKQVVRVLVPIGSVCRGMGTFGEGLGDGPDPSVVGSGTTPVSSAALLAYLAKYPATCSGVSKALALKDDTTILALEGTSGTPFEARGWELWAPLALFIAPGSTLKSPTAWQRWCKRTRNTPCCSSTRLLRSSIRSWERGRRSPTACDRDVGGVPGVSAE
jgi:hypothetical protein